MSFYFCADTWLQIGSNSGLIPLKLTFLFTMENVSGLPKSE